MPTDTDTAESLVAEMRAIADELAALGAKDWEARDALTRREQVARLRFDALHWLGMAQSRVYDDAAQQSVTDANRAMTQNRADDLESVKAHRANAEVIYRDGFASIAAAIREPKP